MIDWLIKISLISLNPNETKIFSQQFLILTGLLFYKDLSEKVRWKFKLYFCIIILHLDDRRKLEENEPDAEENMFSLGWSSKWIKKIYLNTT